MHTSKTYKERDKNYWLLTEDYQIIIFNSFDIRFSMLMLKHDYLLQFYIIELLLNILRCHLELKAT